MGIPSSWPPGVSFTRQDGTVSFFSWSFQVPAAASGQFLPDRLEVLGQLLRVSAGWSNCRELVRVPVCQDDQFPW